MMFSKGLRCFAMETATHWFPILEALHDLRSQCALGRMVLSVFGK